MRAAWLGWSMGFLALTACGDESGGGDDGSGKVTIASTPLSGLVGGESWTVALAEADAFLSEGEPDFWVDAYSTARAACQSRSPGGPHLILDLPKQPGAYRLSLRRNATFVIEGADATFENLIATEGRLVVDEVTDSVIRGGAYVRFDAQNSVNGRFEASICR